MIVGVKYKGEPVDKNDIEVIWTDCFGELRADLIEKIVRDYADEQVGIEMAGEDW